jgi:hypothetical protein
MSHSSNKSKAKSQSNKTGRAPDREVYISIVPDIQPEEEELRATAEREELSSNSQGFQTDHGKVMSYSSKTLYEIQDLESQHEYQELERAIEKLETDVRDLKTRHEDQEIQGAVEEHVTDAQPFEAEHEAQDLESTLETRHEAQDLETRHEDQDLRSLTEELRTDLRELGEQQREIFNDAWKRSEPYSKTDSSAPIPKARLITRPTSTPSVKQKSRWNHLDSGVLILESRT